MTSKDKISKAKNVRKVDPIYNLVAEELSKIDRLQHVKIYNGRIQASNILSTNGKKEPITVIGKENIIGVELLVDVPNKIIQFFSITSSVKGYGSKIVSAVVDSAPNDWTIVVLMDWNHGFWHVMAERYPRLIVC
jgi:hypothetical protein